jgi:hypothetical protein
VHHGSLPPTPQLEWKGSGQNAVGKRKNQLVFIFVLCEKCDVYVVMVFSGLTVGVPVCWDVGSEIHVLGPARAPNVLWVPMSFHWVSLCNLSTSLGTPVAPSDDGPASNQGYQQLHAQPPLRLQLVVEVVVCILQNGHHGRVPAVKCAILDAHGAYRRAVKEQMTRGRQHQ